jgi:putative transposase
MNKQIESLSHTQWECKYHVIFLPKYRRKVLYGEVKRYLGEIFHELVKRKESKILQGHLHKDHVHILMEIPPKYSVSEVVGFLKGKSAIAIARNYMGKVNLRGQNFWARGYMVSTVGTAETAVRQYIAKQEKEDKRLDQLSML